jgi:GNAT superfamily N-acetyltransferase
MRISWEKFHFSDTADLMDLMQKFAQAASLPWDVEKRKRNINEFTSVPISGDVWFICADDKRIGYVVSVSGFSFELGGRVVFIDEFYIEPSHQRQGVGRQTLDFVARDAVTRGWVAIFLEASDSESHLNAFYEKSGFRRRDYRLYCKTLQAV